MELSFIVAAVRRYLWVVYACAILGLVAGLYFPASRADAWESSSSVIVRPPADDPTQNRSVSDPRYIESQVSVLESDNLAQQVAVQFGLPFEDVSDALTVTSDAANDVLVITVEAATAEDAIALANGFKDRFLANRRAEVRDRNADLIAIIDEQLEALGEQLDNQTTALLQLPVEATNDNERLQLATIQGQILNTSTQIDELIANRTVLDFAADSTSRDETVQTAIRADKVGTNSPVLTIAGTFAGLLLGVAAVVTYAGVSGRLLDTVALEEALGIPVVGVFARTMLIPGRPRIKTPVSALEALPDASAPVIDDLCVRAEASAPGPGTLLVVVTGSRDPAATTTTTLAMAGRLSLSGTRVLVVDADFADPRITDALVGEHPGVTDFLASRDELDEIATFGQPGVRGGGDRRLGLAQLTLTHEQTRVGVIGVGTNAERRSIQRADEDHLIQALRSADADVVLVDAGPMLKSAASVRLAQVADVTVLTVPYRQQNVEPLRVIRRLLTDSTATVLPVATEPRR